MKSLSIPSILALLLTFFISATSNQLFRLAFVLQLVVFINQDILGQKTHKVGSKNNELPIETHDITKHRAIQSPHSSNFDKSGIVNDEGLLNYLELRYTDLGLNSQNVQRARALLLNKEIDLSSESYFDRIYFLYNCLKQNLSNSQIIQYFEWYDKINLVYLNSSSMTELQTEMKSLTGQTIDADLLRKLTSFDENNQDEIVVFFVSENVRLGSILN